MLCMKLKRFWMLNDFEAEEIQRAKKVLENDLFVATKVYQEQQEKQKYKAAKPSFWKKVKAFFSDLF